MLCVVAGCRQEGESSLLLPASGEEGTGSPGSGEEESGSPGEEGTGSLGSGEEESGSPGSGEEGRSASDADAQWEAGSGSDAEMLIYVQVSGAVVRPGVYALPAGARIFQAIELAGGLTGEAESSSLNQAGFLADGQMVYVMDKEEAAAWAAGASAEDGSGAVPGMPGGDVSEGQPGRARSDGGAEDGKVNLNTATESDLMALPGIGAAKAKSILAWREENGGFSQIEDLMKIQGIKEGVFSKIKDSVKVE
ncbi:MAG: hypothetical protein HFH40_04065 [Lachnospiraceae bacterium]|nr:hypothetical protein [Lachnospiraceae bacterium]